MTDTPLLDTIHDPADLRRLPEHQLTPLADELRDELIRVISRTGGHLGAGLGVIELTIALHYVYNTPLDKLVWDVGHQTYPHKMLTGRREKMEMLRKAGGLSGFCKRDESAYDTFGAGHSSTSVSAALGMSRARDHRGDDYDVVAVIGDGAISAGMAYEALNNAGSLHTPMTIILNDNEMSIAPAVGAMSNHLSRLAASESYHQFRDIGKQLTDHLPEPIRQAARRAEQYARGVGVGGGSIFEELGLYYIGPVDGHNLDHLLPVIHKAKLAFRDRPVLIHVVTEKGKGFAPAEANYEKYHGVSRFDVDSGKQHKTAPSAPTYTDVFARQLIQEADADADIVAITAAMPSGTGLHTFADAHPERCYDVGIAEQHAVTFAAGLASEGMKPFVTIYSTFLQRAYDQIVHDVAIQNLPVRFAIDRAGLVGADGPTHAGMFDIAYLCCLPNMVVMAAGDEGELVHMVHTVAAHDRSPIAFRYPRGEGCGVALPEAPELLAIGQGRMIEQKPEARIAVLNFGGRLHACQQAIATLAEQDGIAVTLADARFAKPLDEALVMSLLDSHDVLVTVEEGSRGGFAAQLFHMLAQSRPDRLSALRPLTLPDYFQPQGSPEAMYEEAGLGKDALCTYLRQLAAS